MTSKEYVPISSAGEYLIKPTCFGPTETPLDIAFVDKPKCATSSKWVAVVDDFPSKWLGIGGAQDHPGLKQIITGNFNIKKYDLGYKLVFCPPVLVLVLTLRGMMIRTGGVFY
ncbi:hypothetical protein JHK82_025270 [Glycine max]|nr:hypothetical protein JHK87_025215 [Glycine soja]KAG5007353.1 hypothetical protein JHK85_025895 [Glycine max]KAG5134082.1 hypothetical protein JHK82_025270 [Glycine max]